MSVSYDDIIHLSRPVSATHPKMSRSNRAAQFAPFAALTGFTATIQETARLTDEKIELSEDAKETLNQKLGLLGEDIDVGISPEATIIYFQPDAHKTGGQYVTRTGSLKKIDDYEKCVVFIDGFNVKIDAILEIEMPLESN